MGYDIIIFGGGTSGCSCAYTAAKLGLKVLIIEKNSFLGGTMTSSLVTPAMKIGTDYDLNNEFYKILMSNLNKLGGQITYSDGNIGWFNPVLMKIVLDDLMQDAGVEVLFDTTVSDITIAKSIVKGITINSSNNSCIDSIYTDNINTSNKILSLYIESKYFIDATGNAKIFEKLNLEFLNDFENKKIKNIFQPCNLRFIMSGVNIKKFSDWIMSVDNDRTVTTSFTTGGQIHLSTAYTLDKNGKRWALEPYFKEAIEQGLITEEDSNYFQIFTVPGMPDSIAFNCPRMLKNVDINNKKQYSEALIAGRKSILRLSKFLQTKFIGFEKSYISSIANTLGIRVSNRIKGKYIYTINDLKTGKKFDTPVLISKYPVDVHSAQKNKSKLEFQEKEYMLPIESLMSEKFDNLYAIGRCISADFEAQAALRIIPSCFSMGEGLAKHLHRNLNKLN